jgi:hypothetical protein
MLLFLALAFADDAFRDVSNVRDFFRLKVPVDDNVQRQTLDIKFKDSVLDMPIFREISATSTGFTISDTEAWSYGSVRTLVKELGRSAGFKQDITPYDMRRGAANRIEGTISLIARLPPFLTLTEVATVAQRCQIMGHSRAEVFMAYINPRTSVDTQSAFLGTPARTDLFEAINRMSVSRDLRAPRALNEAHKAEIDKEPELAALHQKIRSLKGEILASYSTIKSAAGSALHDQFTKAKRDLANARAKRRSQSYSQLRQTFFSNINGYEIKRQLEGSSQELEMFSPPAEIVHSMPERALVAQALFDEQGKHSRADIVDALAKMCHTSATSRRTSHTGTDTASGSNGNPMLAPMELARPRQCLFCLGATGIQSHLQLHSFATQVTLKRHINKMHRAFLDAETTVNCPHPACQQMQLDNGNHLKNHIGLIHNTYV